MISHSTQQRYMYPFVKLHFWVNLAIEPCRNGHHVDVDAAWRGGHDVVAVKKLE